MSLRARIFILTLLFGLVPLLGAVTINLPLVLDRVELFYHKAHVQNLRADFRDLDQHLASRQETLRLLAKIPEPGFLLRPTSEMTEVDQARARYAQWIDQVLTDQYDVYQIAFLDRELRPRFWLERDLVRELWMPSTRPPHLPSRDFLNAGSQLELGRVLISHIALTSQAAGDSALGQISLHLMAKIPAPRSQIEETLGLVIITIDVGGLSRSYRDTYWVTDDGRYLQVGKSPATGQDAFTDFPGLATIFTNGKPELWKGSESDQVLWVPMFLTEQSGHLWVGRRVDASPITAFKGELIARVLGIVLALTLVVFLLAGWVTVRLERMGKLLLSGVRKILDGVQTTPFHWNGPREIRELGRNLSELALKHAEHLAAVQRQARQLEESNRYKSQFLANISHELRTPLNSILLLSKMLASEQGADSEANRQKARVIHEAGRDLKILIDNVLDLSRVEAGKMELVLETLDLVELLRDVRELMMPQFAEKGIAFHLSIEDNAPRSLFSDGERIRQVLKNFLSNALKFTGRGQVLMQLQASQGAQAEIYPIRLSITDTGIGIPETKHQLIFQAFRQADGSTNRKYGGSGLGLAICRELAHLLGGDIELASREGEGSTFSLLLPLAVPAQHVPVEQLPSSAPDQEQTASAEETITADFGGQRILIFSAHVDELLLLTPWLEHWGMEVMAAGDIDEALDTLAEMPCTLLLVSLDQMPQPENHELEVLRKALGCEEIPLLVMAPLDVTSESGYGFPLGTVDWLAKPVESRALCALLGKYLDAGEHS